MHIDVFININGIYGNITLPKQKELQLAISFTAVSFTRNTC